MKQVTDNAPAAERTSQLRLRNIVFAWARHRWDMRKLLAEKKDIEARFAPLTSREITSEKQRGILAQLATKRLRETQRVEEKIAEAEYTYLCAVACRLRVPLPDRLDATLWYVSNITGHRCLTDKALADFKAEIQHAKDNRWQFWQSD
jgi:hypothetical protein